MAKIECCNNCIYADKKFVFLNSFNWYCKKLNKLVELSVSSYDKVKPPMWCPVNEDNGTITPLNQIRPLTYMEKKEALDDITPFCKWEDIKEGDIYHVPPLLTEPRKDIIITSVGPYLIQYRILSSTKESAVGVLYNMYPTTQMVNFLVKHKIQKIEATNI